MRALFQFQISLDCGWQILTSAFSVIYNMERFEFFFEGEEERQWDIFPFVRGAWFAPSLAASSVSVTSEKHKNTFNPNQNRRGSKNHWKFTKCLRAINVTRQQTESFAKCICATIRFTWDYSTWTWNTY